jgi:hypothetical protein
MQIDPVSVNPLGGVKIVKFSISRGLAPRKRTEGDSTVTGRAKVSTILSCNTPDKVI